MQVIEAGPTVTVADRLAVTRSMIAGALLMVGGAVAAWAFLTTPIIGAFIPEGRPTPVQSLAGMLVWAFAIIAPTGLMILGLVRLFRAADAASGLKDESFNRFLRGSLGTDHVAVVNLVVPGGRRVNEIVMGPYGAAVLGDVPAAKASRNIGSRWEIRGPRGRWVPVEPPVERATRDAERVRAWLADEDRDFVVKVYAAVVTGDRRVERSSSCAVVAPRELAAWLLALPAQRGLTPERRTQLVAHLRATAGKA